MPVQQISLLLFFWQKIQLGSPPPHSPLAVFRFSLSNFAKYLGRRPHIYSGRDAASSKNIPPPPPPLPSPMSARASSVGPIRLAAASHEEKGKRERERENEHKAGREGRRGRDSPTFCCHKILDLGGGLLSFEYAVLLKCGRFVAFFW